MVDLLSTEPQVLSVYELTRAVRACLEEGVGEVWVEGEISNYRKQSSGHQYFTLKDDRSQLSCVFFRNTAAAAGAVALADGMQVQVFGDLTVYESRGQYQLVVGLVQGRGVGALQARFEALKRKLFAEGLFDPERKQELPAFPLTVGIVTSPTGAALQDMLNILRRRAPWMRVLVHPVRVQGQGASLEIANAVQEFNAWALAPGGGNSSKAVDLIVVARGGGSIEDLWEFNEEIVARAIAASALPVVSAVGHEIDFTIADFAADLRAPTPSAAAELIAPDTAALREQLGGAAEVFERTLRARVERARDRLVGLASGALEKEPRRRLLDARQRLDLAQEGLARVAAGGLRALRSRLDEKGGSLRATGLRQSLELRARLVVTLREKLDVVMCCEQARVKARLHAAEGLLRVLGPQGTLQRGYTITLDDQGRLVRSPGDVEAGEQIVTRFQDGEIRSTVAA